MTTPARQRYTEFRKAQPRAPRLARRTVRTRGLEFAVFSSPLVEGLAPLLCVNGGLIYAHSLLWPALSPLSARRQLILYDQRGRGASQAPPAFQSSRIEYDAGDIAALREALGIARWDILGHSWGGGIAMLAAAKDPRGVRRLVLVDAVGPTSEWLPSLHSDALARLRGPERDALAAIDPASLLSGHPTLHAEYSRALYPAYFADHDYAAVFSPPREASATGAAVAGRLRREGYDWRSLLDAVTARTLVVHGLQDVLPPSLARETAALILRAELALIDRAGHMPFWEQPAAFFDRVSAFLDDADRGA